jgi:hypothetical protein
MNNEHAEELAYGYADLIDSMGHMDEVIRDFIYRQFIADLQYEYYESTKLPCTDTVYCTQQEFLDLLREVDITDHGTDRQVIATARALLPLISHWAVEDARFSRGGKQTKGFRLTNLGKFTRVIAESYSNAHRPPANEVFTF